MFQPNKQEKINFCVTVTTQAQIDAVLAIVKLAGGPTGGIKNRELKDTHSVYSSSVVGYAWPSCFKNWQGSSDGKQFDTVEAFTVWYLDADKEAKERAEKQAEVDRLERELLVAKHNLKQLTK